MTARLARFISGVFDPIPMTVLVGILGIFQTPMTATERMFWFMLVGVMTVVVGFVLVWFVKQGYVFDARLSVGKDRHRDRLGVLWLTTALLGLAVAVAWYLDRPEPLWSTLLGMTVMLGVTSGITGYYKISIHLIGITSFATVLLLQYRRAALPILLLIPIVAWSRGTLNRHTPFQMLLGTTVAAGSFIVTFYLTGQLEH